MDESLLLQGLIGSDMQCFEYLVSSYGKRIFDFIYQMIRNKHAAEDLTQDVFLKVFESLHKLNTGYALKPWLFRIAYNMTMNHIKRNKNKYSDIDMGEIASNKDYISDLETKYVILKEIESFKPDCRAIFLMRIMEDLSFDQIALMLGTTAASVKLKFYRSRKALIQRLGDSFGEV
jgi:RNA polymerase sigma-70 factor (ECF subfamily)